MLLKNSRAREARGDTLIKDAPERALLKLADLYSLPWFKGAQVDLQDQRALMRAALYGARGTFTGFYSIVRALLSSQITTIQGTLTRTNTGSYITSPEISSEWGDDRIIEVKTPDSLRSFSSLFSVTQSSELRVYVSQSKSFKHNFAPRSLVLSPVSESVTLSLLPFRLLEPNPANSKKDRLHRPCEILLEISDTALSNIQAGYYRTLGLSLIHI